MVTFAAKTGESEAPCQIGLRIFDETLCLRALIILLDSFEAATVATTTHYKPEHFQILLRDPHMSLSSKLISLPLPLDRLIVQLEATLHLLLLLLLWLT